MELNENELGKVAGGTVIETKEGKFVLMPPHAKEFTTREEAEETEKNFPHPRRRYGHSVYFSPPFEPQFGNSPKMEEVESDKSGKPKE